MKDVVHEVTLGEKNVKTENSAPENSKTFCLRLTKQIT